MLIIALKLTNVKEHCYVRTNLVNLFNIWLFLNIFDQKSYIIIQGDSEGT